MNVEQKVWAIKAWNDLADNAAVPHKAALYRETARAIQHEIDTGVAVCVCCWKPIGVGTRIPGLQYSPSQAS